MPAIFQLQGWVSLLLGVTMFAMQLWALIDCATTPANAFLAADKRTKAIWLAVTGLAALIGFVFVTAPFNIFPLLAIVAAGVYLADVRPAVRSVRGRGSNRRADGPYGPW